MGDVLVKEKDKKISRNIFFYILAFAIPVICMIIHMILTECYPFGDNTILYGDANTQYFGFFREWLSQINDGGSFLFSWNGAMGYEFYTTYWYYLASPFSWLVLLFGQNHLELGMIFVMLLQIGGCGVTACYYFMHSKINKMEKGRINSLLCVLFSVAYSMCDFILAYQYELMWLISLILLPLVLLGIEKLVDKKDGRLYCITLFLAFLTNFYFAWFVCIFAVVWFIDQKKENIKAGLKGFIRFAGLSIMAALAAAAVLIPCYLLVLSRNDKLEGISNYSLDTFGNIGDFLQGFFWGYGIDFNGSDMFTANNYCGIFVVFLVLLYVFVKKIDLSQKIKRIIEIVVLAFCMNWIGTVFVLHGFTLPHGFANRFAFILLFIMVITAFETLQRIDTVRIRYLAIAVVTFIAAFAVVLIFNSNVQDVWCYLITIMIFAYLSMCLFFLKRKSIKKTSFVINILVIGLAELIVNPFLISDDAYSILMEKSTYADEWSDVYQSIETDNGDRKTACISDSNCFQYSDTSTFSSVINSGIVEYFDDLGLTYQRNGNSLFYRGTTPLTATLFDVDYVLTDDEAYFGGYELFQSYESESTDETYGLYTSVYDTEIGFMVSDDILDWDLDDENPFEVQNNFTRDVLGQGDIFTEVTIDEIEVGCSNCVVEDITDNAYTYLNTDASDLYYAGFELSFTVSEDMDLYVYISDENLAKAYILIDGETYLEGAHRAPGTTICLGDLKEGQSVVIGIYNSSTGLTEGTTYVDFYKYNDDVMQSCVSVMNENPLVIDTFEDTYVSGTVTVDEDGVLYTSIPYYKGWTLYVDGVETEITKIADAVVGVELSAGAHTIELKYFPYGLKLGIIFSIIGIVLMFIYFWSFRKTSRIKIRMSRFANKAFSKIVNNTKTPYMICYLCVFLIPIVCMLINMIRLNCYPFGIQTILNGDANIQYMQLYYEWYDKLSDGGSWFFDITLGMGTDFYTTYWYYLGSPFTWIVMLFGKNYMELGMIVSFLIQIGCCGITTCYFFLHTRLNKMDEGIFKYVASVLFTLAFVFCDYMLAYQYNSIWLISFMLLPIVLIGIERLVALNDGRQYLISLALVLITNFYFAWFVCLFAVVWFIDQKKESVKKGLKAFGRFALFSVLSAMCAAAVLIPCYLLVFGREDSNWADLSTYGLSTFANFGNFLQGFFWGSDIDLTGIMLFTNNNYCGIFVLFLVLIYAFRKNIDRTQKIKRLILILVSVFCMEWVGTLYVLHGFNIPHGLSSRFAFILLFMLVITAFEGFMGIKTIRLRWLAVISAIFVLMTAIILGVNNDMQSASCYLVSIMLFVYLVICTVLYKRKSIKLVSLMVNICVIGFVELISNYFVVGYDSYDYLLDKRALTDEWGDIYDSIETDAGERKTSWFFESDCFYQSDTNIFVSTNNTDTEQLYSKLGLTYSTNGTSYQYRGTTPLTAALFNVDYVLTNEAPYFGGYNLVESYEAEDEMGLYSDRELVYGLYETDYDAELAFMLPDSVLNWNTNEDNALEVQNNFTNEVLGQEDIFTEVIFDDLEIDSSGCEIVSYTENSYSYADTTDSDSGYYAIVGVRFTVPYDMHLYCSIKNEHTCFPIIEIDGETYFSGITNAYITYNSPTQVVNLGELKAGQEVVVYSAHTVASSYEGQVNISFYEYNDEVMQDCLEIMNEEPLVLDTFEDTYVSGTVTADEAGVLYTSIPYSEGWTLYVDGVETEITKIADALIGVELSAGEHTIELKYFPYGLKLGIIISLLGLAGMCAYFIYFKKKRNAIKK